MGACATLGMSNQDALSENLESDPLLNFALQRFVCEPVIQIWFIPSTPKYQTDYGQALLVTREHYKY